VAPDPGGAGSAALFGIPFVVRIADIGIEAFSDLARCEARQTVRIQRRRPGSVTFKTFATRTTSAGGSFSVATRPTATTVYRARVAQTAACAGGVSDRERVSVRRR